ncbi:MAG: PQQ-binding-like beta-propeller repeat protein [Planctomycetota bacterium]
MTRSGSRMQRRMPLAILAALGTGFFVCLSQVIAAPPNGAASAEADGSAGLRIAQDRQADQWLDAARGRIERQEFGPASALLARVFGAEEESFAINGSASMLARDEAWQLAKRLPDGVRMQLEADLDRTAGDAWNIVRASDSRDEITAFAIRHRYSVAGLESLRTLAAARRDASQHESAAAAWARVSEHPRATKVQRTAARLARIESLIAATRPEEAARVCRAALNDDLAPAIALAGQNVSPRDWLVARQNELTEALAARVGSPLPPNADRRLVLNADPSPALMPSWSRLTPPAADLAKTVSDTQHYFRGQGVVSSLAMRPLVVGRVVLARTMEHLTALDLTTGEPIWKEPVPHPEYAWIAERPLYLENESFRTGLIGAWHRRTEADSVFGSLATDGRIVIAVMEPDRSRLDFPLTGAPRPGIQNGLTADGPRWNRLSAYEISTGELRWQIGGKATGPADLYGGLRFLGPPLPLDNLLFGIARREYDPDDVRDDELSLLAIDSQTGHLRWSIALGFLPVHLAEAVARRRIACPVSLADGRLLCPTASGALIAVDPVTRGIAWACRYPVDQHDLPTRPVNGIGATPATDAWWNEWREVTCLSSSQLVVLASPESDKLQAIDLNDGRSLWSVSRSGALHLTGLFDELAIVIEPMAVRAHDLRTGAVRWRCETGEISGRGTIVGTKLLQPRRGGGVAVVDLRNGSRRDCLVSAETVLGTLIPCGDGWISQTDQSLVKLPLLTQAREEALAKWTNNRTDETAALELARLDLQSGDPAAARGRLLDIDTPGAKGLRREALLALLRPSGTPRVFDGRGVEERSTTPFAEPQGVPPNLESLAKELLALCESNDERLVALRAVGEAASAANDPVKAVTSFLEGLELLDTSARKSIGEWSADGVAARSVRRDRAFVGAIERVLADAAQRVRRAPDDSGADELQRLERTLAAQLQSARGNSDPFAVQRLVDRMLPLEWGRKTLLTEAAAVRFARTLKKAEPALLAVSTSRDERLAAEGASQLAELFTRSGWRTEADAIGRRVLIEHPGVVLGHGQTWPAELAANSRETERRARLLSPPVDPWPNVIPQMELESRPHGEDVHYAPVSVEATPGSLLDRLDVSVDRQARFVRFAGEGHIGKWRVTLAGPSPPLRSSFAIDGQCEAWGVGRTLILRLGTELFCISPLDERGEPHEKLEWSLNTTGVTREPVPYLDYPSPPNTETVRARVGLRHESQQLVDGFGRAMGRVGPVRPDYLCFLSQARLVAIDTQTGKRLWERLDVPPHCVTFGDEERVYLWRTAEQTLQVLSAIDGRTIEDRPWNASSDDVLMQRGSLTWLATSTGPGTNKSSTRIELHDARDGSIRWSSPFALKAVPFVLDRDTLGVVEPSGLLHLLTADTGQPLGEALTVNVPAKLERIVCHRDAWRWYVAFSGPVERQGMLQTEQIWGGRRLPFLNGPWYAIDRATTSIAWRRTLDNEPLSLDASRMAPVFVQMWRQPNLDNTATKGGEGWLRLIDKRSGREVAFRKDPSLQPYFVLYPTANREMLDIRTERETVRLKYEREIPNPKNQTPNESQTPKGEIPNAKE